MVTDRTARLGADTDERVVGGDRGVEHEQGEPPVHKARGRRLNVVQFAEHESLALVVRFSPTRGSPWPQLGRSSHAVSPGPSWYENSARNWQKLVLSESRVCEKEREDTCMHYAPQPALCLAAGGATVLALAAAAPYAALIGGATRSALAQFSITTAVSTLPRSRAQSSAVSPA